MGKAVIVVGIRGVGKSSVMEGVVKKYKGVRQLTFSDYMLEICKEKGLAEDRDDLRKLPYEQYAEIKAETWDRLANQKDDIMIDTHAFVEHTGRYVPGLPQESMRKFKNLCGLFFIDVDNDTIRARSERDKTRIREGHTDLELNNWRYANLAALSYYSTALNIPLYVIFNEEGKLKQTVETFVYHLKDAFGK